MKIINFQLFSSLIVIMSSTKCSDGVVEYPLKKLHVNFEANSNDEQISFKDDSNSTSSNQVNLIGGSRVGVIVFTRYCGPGSRLINKLFKQSDERTFRNIDFCCKQHDECPNFVETTDHYTQYPGLAYRPQFFSRSGNYKRNCYQCPFLLS